MNDKIETNLKLLLLIHYDYNSLVFNSLMIHSVVKYIGIKFMINN